MGISEEVSRAVGANCTERKTGSVEPDRFRTVVAMVDDKPDFLDLGSPVTPLRLPAATHTSSSSSSSGSGSAYGKATGTPPSYSTKAALRTPSGTDPRRKSLSGELCDETSPAVSGVRNLKTDHRRWSCSGPLISSGAGGGSTASSPTTNVLPTGNICPSGKIAKTGMIPKMTPRNDVLGSGTANYGHGSIMQGGVGGSARAGGDARIGNFGDSSSRRVTGRMDPQEVTRAGNEHYMRAQYKEALAFYDQAVAMCPENAACRSNRAAALTGLGRFAEAVRESEEALRLNPANGRAHHRLACLYLRLGLVEDARKHHFIPGHQSDPVELQKLPKVESLLVKCGDARKIEDWKSALREADAAIAAGVDSSLLVKPEILVVPMQREFIQEIYSLILQLSAFRAEALLHLEQLDEADSVLSRFHDIEDSFPFFSATKIFGMLSFSYFYIVRAQVDVAFGRFDNALIAAEKARQLDARNVEATMILSNVRSVARSRAQGNVLFNSGNYAEACTTYGEGLKYYPSNPVLLSNRAACYSKLGQWEKSVRDCNQALSTQPNYTKALLRRADSHAKLENWTESVRDYEAVRKELPGDTEVAEALIRAQIALKTSLSENDSNLKFGGGIEKINSMDQLQAAISSPGSSVFYFMSALNLQCTQISPFVDELCSRYPFAKFHKVDINQNPAIAKAEKLRIVPTFVIYKNGTRAKEMICPSQQVLEYSVRHYSL